MGCPDYLILSRDFLGYFLALLLFACWLGSPFPLDDSLFIVSALIGE
jgi:hypothetical protein